MSDVLAYHEAGHALMAWLAGAEVRRVTIEPDRGDDPHREGDTQVAWHRSRMSNREFAHKSVQVCLAGPVAEMIYTGECDADVMHQWSADWSEACLAAQVLFPRPERQMLFLQQAAGEIYRMFQGENVWAAIAALADELLAHETLDADQVNEIAEFWLG